MEKLEWCGYLTVKKFEDMFIRFDAIYRIVLFPISLSN